MFSSEAHSAKEEVAVGSEGGWAQCCFWFIFKQPAGEPQPVLGKLTDVQQRQRSNKRSRKQVLMRNVIIYLKNCALSILNSSLNHPTSER